MPSRQQRCQSQSAYLAAFIFCQVGSMFPGMEDDLYPSQKADRIMVRLPEGMRDRLNAAAKANGRSANAEVVLALDAWLSAERSIAPYAGLSAEENDALGRVVLDAVASAITSAPGSPAWDGFRKMLLATGEFALLDEEGQPVKPDDRLADKGKVEGGQPYPRRIETPTSPEVQAERDRRIEEAREWDRKHEAAKQKAKSAR